MDLKCKVESLSNENDHLIKQNELLESQIFSTNESLLAKNGEIDSLEAAMVPLKKLS